MLYTLEPNPYKVSKTEMQTLGYPNPHAFAYILHPLRHRTDSFHIDLAPLLREVNHQGDNTYGTPLYLSGIQLRRFMNNPAKSYQYESPSLPMAAEPPSLAYKLWTSEQDEELIRLFTTNIRYGEIAKQLRRSRKAIISRLKKLGKITPQ